jgi:hypothetical protein
LRPFTLHYHYSTMLSQCQPPFTTFLISIVAYALV